MISVLRRFNILDIYIHIYLSIYVMHVCVYFVFSSVDFKNIHPLILHLGSLLLDVSLTHFE